MISNRIQLNQLYVLIFTVIVMDKVFCAKVNLALNQHAYQSSTHYSAISLKAVGKIFFVSVCLFGAAWAALFLRQRLKNLEYTSGQSNMMICDMVLIIIRYK